MESQTDGGVSDLRDLLRAGSGARPDLCGLLLHSSLDALQPTGGCHDCVCLPD